MYAPWTFSVETTVDPEIQAPDRDVRAQARAGLGAILGRKTGAERIAGSAGALALEIAAEVIRAGLAGIAIRWSDHAEVPREQIVATASTPSGSGTARRDSTP